MTVNTGTVIFNAV